MTIDETLAEFARHFVQSHYRERFLHDARRRPEKLDSKVSHASADIFEPRTLGGSVQYDDADPCLFFFRSGFINMPWGEAMRRIEAHGGGGYLVIDATGRKFFAQSEGFPPPQTHAGQA